MPKLIIRASCYVRADVKTYSVLFGFKKCKVGDYTRMTRGCRALGCDAAKYFRKDIECHRRERRSVHRYSH